MHATESESISSKFEKIRTQLPYVPQALRLVWTAARPWAMAWVVLLLIQGVLPTVTLLLTRSLVDTLASALGPHRSWAPLSQVLVLAGLMAIVLLAGEGLRILTTWVRTAQAELVQDHVQGLIHKQAIRLDLSFYDSPEYYDQLHRARVDAINRPVALIENSGSLVQNGITITAMAGILLGYAWWLPAVLLLSTLPALWVVVSYTMRFHQWRLHNTSNERRTRYYDWMLTWQQAAAELRLFDLGDLFRRSFRDLRGRLRRERIDLAKRQMVAELAAAVIALLVMGMTMVWLVWRGFQGWMNLGDLVLFYQVFSQGQRMMRTLLGSAGEVYWNMLFLENLFQFLALEPLVADSPQPVGTIENRWGEIRFTGVTFRYPGSERTALKDFSLTLPAAMITAIVGENGAGKSTLIKLLCRFYDPEAGQISIDGVGLKEIPLAELRRRITVLFQEPVRYQDTAANNIAFGDLAREPGPSDLEAASRAAGADGPIGALPQGYRTVLGKWFGGAELSVGEWQRLALARAFFRRASLVILDEPTSAMDSWAEADWLMRFRGLVSGCTTLIITHRFTTALHADMIHVMDRGRIVESGSHVDLLSLKGRYSRSWARQMRSEPCAHSSLDSGPPAGCRPETGAAKE